MKQTEDKASLFERIAHGYFYGSSSGQFIAHDYRQGLSKEQFKQIKKIKLRALILSAVAGTLGVLLLYVPPVFWPKIFELWTVKFQMFGSEIPIPFFALLYGIVLAVVEIYYLVFLNIRAVHGIARLCGFPPKDDPDYHMHVRSLVNIGVEKNAKNELSIGLNPLQGYSKFRVVMIFIWNRAKATLSNMLFKMLLRRILGRYVLRVYIELAGIPIMAGWNVYAANKVIDQAKIRILSPGLIQYTILYLHKKYKNDAQFKDLIYDVLQFLAVKKRTFHENHYLLSINLIRTFGIDVKQLHEIDHDDFIKRIKNLPADMQDDIAYLIIIGMIIDGHLSPQEKQSLREMQQMNIIDFDIQRIKNMMLSFKRGNGVTVLRDQFKMHVE